MADKNKKQDDYLGLSKYENHPASKENPNFSTFTHDDEHYFAMLDKKGAVALRSEGYSSEKSRDNGIESVMKNKGLEERWSITEAMNHFFLSLKAGNHQEIGKSGSFKTKAEAESYLSFLLGKGGAAPSDAGAPKKSEGGHSAGYAEALAKSGFVAGKIISEKRNVIGETRNTDGNFSAGYAAALAASGIVAGKIISEKRNAIGETRNQIKETRNDKGVIARNLIGEKRNPIGETKNLINTTRSSRADVYLPCPDYLGHNVVDKKNNVAFFKKNGNEYFAIYNKDGSVRLRSEGFKNAADRDVELKQALSLMGDKKNYKTVSRGRYTLDLLRNKDGREVARTCLTGKAMIAQAASIALMSKLGHEDEPEPIPASRGLGLWPLAMLLLLPLIFLLGKCTPTPIIGPPPLPIVAPAPVVAPVITCDCSKLTHPIFKLPAGAPPKATTVLGRAPEYGNSHHLDAPGFYNKLKTKFASSQMEKDFLNGIFKQMGYENGFSDATADLFKEVEVPYGVDGNLGTKVTHKTVYRKLNTSKKDRQAFRIKAKNACDFHFMKTCGNHFFHKGICGTSSL